MKLGAGGPAALGNRKPGQSAQAESTQAGLQQNQKGYQNGWSSKRQALGFFFYKAFWYPFVLVTVWVVSLPAPKGVSNGWISKWQVFEF